MLQTQSTELYYLVLLTGMTAMMWIPYIINRLGEQGVIPALWDPHGHTEAKAAWANRMMLAHTNAVENLIIFAPLVLIIHMTGQSTALTQNACVIYLIARVIHYFGYSFAIPVVRVVSFLAGFYAQMVLILSLLKVI